VGVGRRRVIGSEVGGVINGDANVGKGSHFIIVEEDGLCPYWVTYISSSYCTVSKREMGRDKENGTKKGNLK